MKLTEQEKSARARQRMIDHTRQFQIGTYAAKFVAPLFQRMIRAEAAALPRGMAPAMFVGIGTPCHVDREVGQCVCVTCGKVLPWKGGVDRYSGMHTGHFLASRRLSILFEEENCAPQCSACNVFQDGSPQQFRMWMLAVRGPEVVERLERLKNEVRTFTREELVDMRIAYKARLDAAEARMAREQ